MNGYNIPRASVDHPPSTYPPFADLCAGVSCGAGAAGWDNNWHAVCTIGSCDPTTGLCSFISDEGAECGNGGMCESYRCHGKFLNAQLCQELFALKTNIDQRDSWLWTLARSEQVLQILRCAIDIVSLLCCRSLRGCYMYYTP